MDTFFVYGFVVNLTASPDCSLDFSLINPHGYNVTPTSLGSNLGRNPWIKLKNIELFLHYYNGPTTR